MGALRWFRRKTAEEPQPEQTSPTESKPEPVTARLEFEREGEPLTFPLKGSEVIGADRSCDIVIDEKFGETSAVKGQHLRIEVWKGRWVAVPLGPEAVVLFDGRRGGETVLKDGCRIQLGEDGPLFTFRDKGAAER